jgi:MerR family transcriptional regulator, light-induced transcriptional regulator
MVAREDVEMEFSSRIGDEPLYNIGVVTRMTGISKATLRAWERRYGFPDSERTTGGHRLYSERDIIHLRWVKNRIDQGMQTAQAIRALRHQEANKKLDEDLVTDVRDESPVVSMPEGDAATNPLMMVYQRRLMQAFSAKDTAFADQVVGEALASISPENLILEVLAPTLAHIGHAWENDNVTIAVEHLATNYIRHRLMQWMLSSPPARNTAPIVMACGPGEWHEMSLLILATLLRRRRWPIAYLGQSMPLSDLTKFVAEIKPSLVLLVAMTEETALQIKDWTRYLPDAAQTGKPVVAYGGRVFVQKPELRLKMPGLYLGDNFSEGLITVETLLGQKS